MPQGGSSVYLPEEDLIFARLRAYVEQYGRTSEIRGLRERLSFPGITADWATDLWDPSHNAWGI